MPKNNSVRRFLLKPLKRRRSAVSPHGLLSAFDRLDSRAVGESELQAVLSTIQYVRGNRSAGSWKDPRVARELVSLARALYAARRISRTEYVFYAASAVEGIHESRILGKEYDSDLRPVADAIAKLDEQIDVGEPPAQSAAEGEYVRLNREYELILDRAFNAALREFGLDDLAVLWESAPIEFRRLRERGRRSVFHKDDVIPALKDVVVQYEEDARRAAAAGAYSAAITQLGAGLEGLLLLRCLRSKSKARRFAASLPRRVRPRDPNDPTTWTFESLIETCFAAGWLPLVSTDAAQYSPAGLAHLLRAMRNYVHPWRYARERAWSEVEERDFLDADAIYRTLMAVSLKPSQKKQKLIGGAEQ